MQKTKSVGSTIASVVIWIVCILLALILVCNLTIIIKGSINPDTPPEIFGVMPLIVPTDSMSTPEGAEQKPDHIEAGDFIIVTKPDRDNLKVGDVITFMENGYSVTHRIIGIDEEGKFITKGDFNNIEDKKHVAKEDVVGIYNGFRIAGIGYFAEFIGKPVGMLVFIGIPIIAFIVYDIIRRKLQGDKLEKERNSEADALRAELEALKAAQAAQAAQTIESAPADNTPDAEVEAPADTPDED